MAETEKKKRQKPLRVLSNTLYLLGMAWKISPRFFFGYIFDALILTVWSVLDAWYFKRVFDLLDAGAPVSEILWMLLAVAVTMAAFTLADLSRLGDGDAGAAAAEQPAAGLLLADYQGSIAVFESGDRIDRAFEILRVAGAGITANMHRRGRNGIGSNTGG